MPQATCAWPKILCTWYNVSFSSLSPFLFRYILSCLQSSFSIKRETDRDRTIANTVLEQDNMLKNRELVPPSIANLVQTKYKVCYVPRCRNVNIYSCTRYCPVTTTPCMLDLRLNNWPIGHVYHLEESENLIRQSKHRAVCTLRADRAANLTVE